MRELHQADERQSLELEAQLARLLESRIFQQAPRSRMFLEYVVRLAIRDPQQRPKEYTIAVEVFGCDPTYDSSVDATVRVEAGRLRTRLHDYYANDGKDDPWIIDMPKGAYRVTFQPRPVEQPLAPVFAVPPPQLPDHPLNPEALKRSSVWLLAIVCSFFLVLAAVGWQLWRTEKSRAGSR